jgi:hypothetical protein
VARFGNRSAVFRHNDEGPGVQRSMVLLYRLRAPFVETDIDLLTSAGVLVTERSLAAPSTFANGLRACSDVVNSQGLLVWFATPTAIPALIAARLSGRPSVVIVSGYDVARRDDLGYGAWRTRTGRAFTWLTIALANRVACVSHFSKDELGSRAPHLLQKSTVVEHGFAPALVVANLRRTLLCVAAVTADSYRVKGLDRLIRLAALCPEEEFVLCGAVVNAEIANELETQAPNIQLRGAMEHDALLALMADADVIIQFSRTESFGCAVAEAMSFGATPFVSSEGYLPTVAGGFGSVVDFEVATDGELLVAFSDARGRTQDQRVNSAMSIQIRFPLLRRTNMLLNLLGFSPADAPPASCTQ